MTKQNGWMYETVSLATEEGIKKAEKLHQAGWKSTPAGLDKVMFSKKDDSIQKHSYQTRPIDDLSKLKRGMYLFAKHQSYGPQVYKLTDIISCMGATNYYVSAKEQNGDETIWEKPIVISASDLLNRGWEIINNFFDVPINHVQEMIKNKAEKIILETIYHKKNILAEGNTFTSAQEKEIKDLMKSPIKKEIEEALTRFLKNLWMRSDTFIKSS